MTHWYSPIGQDEPRAPLEYPPGGKTLRTTAIAAATLMSVLLLAAITTSPRYSGSAMRGPSSLPADSDWDIEALYGISQRTHSFKAGDSHELLRSWYAPNATVHSPLATPSGVAQGVNEILNQTVKARSFVNDATFIANSMGVTAHTVDKDTNAITAAVGQYVHTGVDTTGGKQCEVQSPMHIFQEVDENYTIVTEWQHVNYTQFLHNLKKCNTLNLPVGPEVANNVITKVFPEVVDYGWNGSQLGDLVNRFWSDLNEDANTVSKSVTVELQSLMNDLATTIQEAGISSTPVAPNIPSLVIDARSQQWATLSNVVAQEVVGIDVTTGSPCSFRMQWVHAYIVQRHYRIAGFVTAGNSNQFRVEIMNCNKFGTQEYGYKNWKQRQQAAQAIMENLKRNHLLEKLLSGKFHAVLANKTIATQGIAS